MSLIAHPCSFLTLLRVFRTLQVTLAPASGFGAAVDANEGPMATLAPDVILQIFKNLAITDIWNVGSLNSHLRNLAQSEVRHRFRRHFEATFQNGTDAFFEVLRITGGAVFGSSLLDTFYLACIDYGLPPTIVVPAASLQTLHLFLVGIPAFLTFQITWVPPPLRTLCTAKWFYYLLVRLVSIRALHVLKLCRGSTSLLQS